MNVEDVKNITNHEVLADLALNNPNWQIRLEAIRNPNLRDEYTLEKVLLTEKEDYINFHAFKILKFVNPKSSLFLKPSDVLKITDEEKLVDIINNSIYKAPAIVGGFKVDICRVYPYLVCPDTRWEVRYCAVMNSNLTRNDVLERAALKDYDIRVRIAAINNPNLIDEELFSYLASDDCKYTVRANAAKYVENEDVLYCIASYDSKGFVRRNALSNPNFHFKSLLKDMAFNDSDYHVRREAVLKINDNSLLHEIFSRDYHLEVKKAACMKFSDKSILNHIINGRFKRELKRIAKDRLAELDNKSDYIKEFERMNTTCESIYDLDDLDVLIILKDGENLTDWDDVSDKNDVVYVSENLLKIHNLEEKYKDLTNMKAIVTNGISDKVNSLKNMFFGCFSLRDISSLKSWDVYNVWDMEGLFGECNSLNDLSPLERWNVSNVVTMRSMFENCFSLGSIAPIYYWETRNVYDMGHIFDDCHSLDDISALEYWNVGEVRNMEYMFSCCNYLNDLSPLSDWNVSKVTDMSCMFEGCDYLSDISPLADWDISNVKKRENMFSNSSVDDLSISTFFTNDEDEFILKNGPFPII